MASTFSDVSELYQDYFADTLRYTPTMSSVHSFGGYDYDHAVDIIDIDGGVDSDDSDELDEPAQIIVVGGGPSGRSSTRRSARRVSASPTHHRPTRTSSKTKRGLLSPADVATHTVGTSSTAGSALRRMFGVDNRRDRTMRGGDDESDDGSESGDDGNATCDTSSETFDEISADFQLAQLIDDAGDAEVTGGDGQDGDGQDGDIDDSSVMSMLIISHPVGADTTDT